MTRTVFCAAKLEMPLPKVVNEVMTRLFSLTEAEYPANTLEPKPLMTPWMTMLPMEMKLCCKMLGTATAAMRLSSGQEKRAAFSAVSIFLNRRSTKIRARTQLTPWHRKGGPGHAVHPHAQSGDEQDVHRDVGQGGGARKKNEVLESPRAEKMPVATL